MRRSLSISGSGDEAYARDIPKTLLALADEVDGFEAAELLSKAWKLRYAVPTQ